MKSLSYQCAMDDKDCADCKKEDCSHTCHLSVKIEPTWKSVLRQRAEMEKPSDTQPYIRTERGTNLITVSVVYTPDKGRHVFGNRMHAETFRRAWMRRIDD